MNRFYDYNDSYESFGSAKPEGFEPSSGSDTRRDRLNYKKRRNKRRTIEIVRGVIQLISFLLIPGLFITIFSGVGSIFTAIISGTFVLSQQLVNILIVTAVILMTVLWGRFFCGWICSFGAMQDLLRALGRRITKRNLIPAKADRVLKYFKYAVLLYVVIAVWTLGVGTDTVWSPWTVFGMYASPLSGFPAQLMFLSIGGALLLSIIIGSLFVDRFFCRYLCPLGAIFAPLSKLRIFRVKKPASQCGSCRGCTKSCPMAVPLYKYDEVKSGECIDCLKCTAACHRDNVRVETLPAVSGTVAAMALMGVTFAGTVIPTTNNVSSGTAPITVSATEASVGKFKDGTYTGAAAGFRGDVNVSVTVENGNISDVTVTSSDDDGRFMQQAQDSVIPAIIAQQTPDVDTVSGATYSSRGIIEAVRNALETQTLATEAATAAETIAATEAPQTDAPATEAPATEAPETEAPATEAPATEAPQTDAPVTNGQFTDGVYSGSGTGFRGTTNVTVTVEGGVITDITVTSYQDDDRFFNNAQYGVIADILAAQSVDVDTVSGATYSSNSIKEAVANALGLSFDNPNSSMGGGHGHH